MFVEVFKVEVFKVTGEVCQVTSFSITKQIFIQPL